MGRDSETCARGWVVLLLSVSLAGWPAIGEARTTPPGADPALQRVIGVVRDSSGRPLEGAAVALGEVSGRTDAQGRWALATEPGLLSVSRCAWAQGWARSR